MASGKAEWFCKTENLIYALLAQLVEQLTLNQRAQGSSPWKCTKQRKGTRLGALSLFRWNLRDSDSMGQLMRVLGAPEVSAASGGCSEPERAGQRRRAMRAHVMREVSATRRNRMSPWKCTTKRQDVCPAFFVALPPYGGGFAVRAAGAPVQLAGPLRLNNMPPAYCS